MSRRLADAQRVEAGPVPQYDVGVDDRDLGLVGERLALGLRQLGTEIRDHAAPASQHAALSAHAFQLPAARIADLDRCRTTDVPYAHDRAVEAEACRPGLVEPCVVGAPHRHLVDTAAGNGAWDQPLDEQAREGGVAVGEVQERRALAGARVQSHAGSDGRAQLQARETR